MSILQKTVGLYPAKGFEGQQVVVGQAFYTDTNYFSDGTVKAGGFAFFNKDGVVSATASADTELPIGIVERNLTSTFESVTDEATSVYRGGETVTIALRGQYYIKAPSAGTTGLKILIKPTTGVVSVAATAGTGVVDTGWVVKATDGKKNFAEGDLVIAERF